MRHIPSDESERLSHLTTGRDVARRTFLRAAGVSLALPLLESNGTLFARDDPEPPKRMVLICTALGLHAPALFPAVAGEDYESTEYLDLLAEHRNDFTLLSGLSHPDQGGEHATEMTFLSAARNPGQDGFRNSISVDQYAASRLGHVTRFPSISLSSHGPRSQSYTSSGVMVPAESSPRRLFSRLFLQGSRDEVERQRQKLREGKSILDELMSQTRTLLTTAGSSDRQRLEQYFDAVRTAEQELSEAEVWLDKAKPNVAEQPPTDLHGKSEFIGRARLLFDLIPLILQTDSTRVISVIIQDHQVVPNVDGVTLEHHNLSHHGRDESKITQLKKIERQILSSFSDLLASLKSRHEGPSTLLDNTAILFGSNLGNANAHDPRNLPIILAGGRYRHGRYIARDKDQNTPLCNLFVSMLNSTGLETATFASSTGQLSWPDTDS